MQTTLLSNIVRTHIYRSRRNHEIQYTVTERADGTFCCNCPGADYDLECWHVRDAESKTFLERMAKVAKQFHVATDHSEIREAVFDHLKEVDRTYKRFLFMEAFKAGRLKLIGTEWKYIK